MTVPDISVVMAVHNGQAYLRRAVDSILTQVGTDFEFIVVNDGSTDRTPAILAEYQTRDPRVRVIDQENQGLTRSLVRGCSEARGRYIARQDADDISLPGRLAKLGSLLDSDPRLTFAGSWGYSFAPHGETIARVRRPHDPVERTRLLIEERAGPVGHGSVMMRTSAYVRAGGYRAAFRYAQDWDLWLRLAEVGLMGCVPEELYGYLKNPEGISGRRFRFQQEFGRLAHACAGARRAGGDETPLLRRAEALAELSARAERESWQTRRQVAGMNYHIGACLRSGGDRRATRYFWDAVRLNPLHWRAWIRLAASVLS